MQQTQSPIKIKPKGFDYQRNGVSGIGFYTMIFDWNDRSTKETGKNFIATFETDEEDNQVKIESCRVIDMEAPLEGWRGDQFGYAIHQALYEIRVMEGKPLIYDCQEVINKK